VWSEAAFNRADKAGRFVVIEYNASQHAAQLASHGYHISFRQVVRLATGKQVRAMRGCAPLYTTSHEPDHDGRRAPTTLTLLRGQGPGGRDYAWMKNARRLIAAEILRRRMWLAKAFRHIACIQSRGTKRQIQLLDQGLNLIAQKKLAEVKRLIVEVQGAARVP